MGEWCWIECEYEDVLCSKVFWRLDAGSGFVLDIWQRIVGIV